LKLQVDYSLHPAFRHLISAGNYPDVEIYFAKIDKLWIELISRKTNCSSINMVLDFDKTAKQYLQEFKLKIQTWPIQVDYLPYVLKALDNSIVAIREEIVQIIDGRRNNRPESSKALEICEHLRLTGVAAFRIDSSKRKEIFNALQPFVLQVDAQRDSGFGERCFVPVPSKGVHWDILKKFVAESKIEEAISIFCGFELELVGYALTLSHPDKDWYKICYSDIGLASTKTVQQHFDLDNLSAKSMFYLNEVDSNNGPLSYVPNSREFIQSRSQISFFKYLDYENNEFSKSKLVNDKIYNRPLFRAITLRSAFASLPSGLQGSSCFGDDVLDGTLLSDALLRSERNLTSQDGDLVLFAGGETIHRGGVVVSGQRYALQMIYKKPPKFSEKILSAPRRFASNAKNLLKQTKARL
jgi:hypothetical protein